MKSSMLSRAVWAALLCVVLAAPAWADIADYEFRLVRNEMPQGEGIVAVRLVHKHSERPVPDAVIFAKRIDMAPDRMPTMTSAIEQVPSTEPGVYRFRTNLTMEGGWQLSLAAKVQGEAGTVVSKLVLRAQ